MNAHYLRPNDSEKTPTCHVFVDCETDRTARGPGFWSHKETLRLWVAAFVRMHAGKVVRRRMTSGRTGEGFFQFLRECVSNHYTLWLWAHNATFDFTVLGMWRELEAGRLGWKGGSIGEPPISFKITVGGQEVKCVDSYNWFRASLASMGESVGLPKLEMPARDEPDSVWFAYCQRDVEILERSVCELVAFLRDNRLGRMVATAPGQAWQSWRHIHNGPWPLIHGDESLSRFERQAYYGGRCEVFFRGNVRKRDPGLREQTLFERKHGPTLWDERVYVLDARTFYPACMRNALFPYKYRYSVDSMAVEGLANALKSKGVIAEVKISSDREAFPVRDEGITKYAVGNYWTCLAGPELRYAIDHNCITAVGRTAVYDLADLFTKWVDHALALRARFEREGKTAWADMAKVIANSLYGKFGQRAARWQDRKDIPCREKWGQWIVSDWDVNEVHRYRGIGGNTQEMHKDGEWAHAFVPIAAYVTSRGRVVMRELMNLLPPKTLLYHDTDSLHVTRNGYLTLRELGYVNPAVPGSLVLQKVAGSAEYRNFKVYRLNGTITAGGIPRKATAAGEWRFRFEQWEDFQHMILRGPDDAVSIAEIEAGLSGDYVRGRVGSDGWVSPPIVDRNERLGQISATQREGAARRPGMSQKPLPSLPDE